MDIIQKNRASIRAGFNYCAVFMVPFTVYLYSTLIDRMIQKLLPMWPDNIVAGIIAIAFGIVFCEYYGQEISNFFGLRKPFLALFILSPYFFARITTLMITDDKTLALSRIFSIALGTLAEEIIFRGIVLSYGLRKADTLFKNLLVIVYSSVVFGMTHFIHITYGKSFNATTIQVASAMCMGFVCAIAFFYSRSIWPTWLFHFFNNYVYDVYYPTKVVVYDLRDVRASVITVVYLSCVLVFLYCIRNHKDISVPADMSLLNLLGIKKQRL